MCVLLLKKKKAEYNANHHCCLNYSRGIWKWKEELKLGETFVEVQGDGNPLRKQSWYLPESLTIISDLYFFLFFSSEQYIFSVMGPAGKGIQNKYLPGDKNWNVSDSETLMYGSVNYLENLVKYPPLGPALRVRTGAWELVLLHSPKWDDDDAQGTTMGITTLSLGSHPWVLARTTGPAL